MLDVHTPEHRIGGVRDFLLHILTITVGLLIALALENAGGSTASSPPADRGRSGDAGRTQG